MATLQRCRWRSAWHASHVRRRLKQGLSALLVVAVAEGLLRVGFVLWVYVAPPPHCGLRPELLARLLHVYVEPSSFARRTHL